MPERTDTERVDWLEKMGLRSAVHILEGKGHWHEHLPTDAAGCKEMSVWCWGVRQAIDAAMDKEAQDAQQG